MTAEPYSRRDAIIKAAEGWLGTPYHHQARLKHIGCDCLGLLRGVWAEVYGEEGETPPPYSRDWAERAGQETLYLAARRHMIEIAPKDRQPGDLLLFRWNEDCPAKHCAILVSPSHMIHAYEGAGVVKAALSGWWLRKLAYVFRFR